MKLLTAKLRLEPRFIWCQTPSSFCYTSNNQLLFQTANQFLSTSLIPLPLGPLNAPQWLLPLNILQIIFPDKKSEGHAIHLLSGGFRSIHHKSGQLISILLAWLRIAYITFPFMSPEFLPLRDSAIMQHRAHLFPLCSNQHYSTNNYYY